MHDMDISGESLEAADVLYYVLDSVRHAFRCRHIWAGA